MDEDLIQKAYEARWARTCEAALVAVRDGERDLSRLVHRIHLDTARKQVVGPALNRAFGLDDTAVSFALQRVARAFIADTLLDYADGVDAVVDMGSGWGYNLFNLWLRGGPVVPYYALEFVEPGRLACDLIAKAVPGPDIVSAAFDFRAPVLPRLGVGHALIFSAHALDKVALVSDDLVEEIAGVADRVTVVHFENIYDQLAGPLGLPVNETLRRRVVRQGMNTNFYGLLSAAADAGRIRIDELRPDVLDASSSLLRWSAGPVR